MEKYKLQFKNFISKHFIGVNLLTFLFLIANIYLLNNLIIGLLIIHLYLYLNSIFISTYFKYRLHIGSNFSTMLAYISLLFTIPAILNIKFILCDTVSKFDVIIILFAIASLNSILFVKRKRYFQINKQSKTYNIITTNKKINMVLLYFLFVVVGFTALYNPVDLTTSVWNEIPSTYSYIFTGLTLILLYCIFSKQFSTRKTLILVIIYFLLMHSYFSLVYPFGFSNDVWTHLASENMIIHGVPYTKITGDELSTIKLLNVTDITDLEGVLTKKRIVAKIFYGSAWLLTIFLSYVLGLDIWVINVWLSPILWSIFGTLILFYIAYSINKDYTYTFISTMLLGMFSYLIIISSQTLPASIGALVFILALILLIQCVQNKDKIGLFIVLLISALYYTTSAILLLIFLIILISFEINISKKKQFFLTLLLSFIMPIMLIYKGYEIRFDITNQYILSFIHDITGLSFFSSYSGFEQLFGHNPNSRYISYYLSLNLLPRHYLFSNIILNGLIGMLTTLFTLIGILKILNNWSAHKILSPFILMGIVLYIDYFIMWYLMPLNEVGNRIGIFLNLITIPVLALGLSSVIDITKDAKIFIKNICICTVFILILLSINVSYTSNYNLGHISLKEIDVATYICNNQSNNPDFCVASPNSAIVLRYISHGESRNGGFPVYFEPGSFYTPEQQDIYLKMHSNPSIELANQALNVTNTSICYIIIDITKLSGNTSLQELERMFGESRRFGDLYLFTYTKV